jgi:hypothetical protein
MHHDVFQLISQQTPEDQKIFTENICLSVETNNKAGKTFIEIFNCFCRKRDLAYKMGLMLTGDESNKIHIS